MPVPWALGPTSPSSSRPWWSSSVLLESLVLPLIFVYYLSTKIDEHLIDIGSSSGAGFVIWDLSPFLGCFESAGSWHSSVVLQI
jgi:hypothetical protein